MPTLEETFVLASRHHEAGDLRTAEYLYRLIIDAAPGCAEAHSCLGVALAQQGKLEQAAASLEQAIHSRSDFPEAHNDFANVLLGLGRLDDAVAHYRQAIVLRADYPEAHNNLGIALARQGKLDDAVVHHRQAVQLNQHYATAHYNLGSVLERQSKLDEAIACYRQALHLQPNLAEAWNNLGIALERQDKLDDAVASFQEALRLRPGYAEAYNNLGKGYYARGRVAEALAQFEQALRVKPDYADAHANRALLWLLQGDFEQGWQEYEWRWAQPGALRRGFRQPLWDGAALEGRTILLHSEQGLGDTVQFIRYVSLVKERGGKVIVQCQAPLVCLLSGLKGIDQIVAMEQQIPDFDVHVPLLSLPGIFRTTLACIPAPVPYLHADQALVDRWRATFPKRPAFRVGIAWQGNPSFRSDRQRSIPLMQFQQLATVPDVELVSLQKGPGTDQLRGLQGKFSVTDLQNVLGGDNESFANIAAIMMHLDLVISCDTAIAHLAGALGVNVWVALPLLPDWRWLLQREDSPWYPTMRLFRQTRYGQWGDVFDRMAEELKRAAGGTAR
jgi:Flp pilus assembly protein TadD